MPLLPAQSADVLQAAPTIRRVRSEEGLRDRSSRPKTCPHQTDAEIVSKIVYLRQHYHFGPAKISMYLARYHEVTVSKSGVPTVDHPSSRR